MTYTASMTDRAYARISLDTAVSGSITKQRSRLARLAVDPEWYVDESVSGSKVAFADRPHGGRLLRDLRPGDRVLVTKIDRAARNVRDLLGLVERIESAGASIVFVDQNIDTAGPMGRFLLTLLGAVAELEAAIIAERRRESLATFKEEGRHAVGRPPFGLRTAPHPTGRGLVLRPDPEQAAILRQVVDDVLSGLAQREGAKRVGMGAPAFGRLLRNARLAGINGTGADGALIDDEQAIFSPAEWARLQDFLSRPVKSWSKASGYGPALRCSVCDDRLYLNVSGRKAEYSTYRCRGTRHKPGDPASSVIRVNADRLMEETFLARFGRYDVRERVEVGDSSARDDAIARARLDMDAIRAAQDATTDDSEEERLFAAYLKAKRALRDAEALPSSVSSVELPTGETYAQAWAIADDDERSVYLQRFGSWVVAPGRLPLAEKITFQNAEPDYEPTLADLE